jgi:UDP-N-acetylglucosamine 2-epimerase
MIKVSSLLKILPRESYKTVFTGQHTTLLFGVDFDYKLEISDGDNRLDSVIQSCLNRGYIFDGITHVLVQGDTSSAFGMALTAYHRKIKVIHLEAGLRSGDFNNPYPEEMNRCLITKLADIHLCPTTDNIINLLRENIKYESIYVVGNTGLDGLVNMRERTTLAKKILITLHRRENHDKIDEWFKKINELATEFLDYNFVFPIHPNPNVRKHREILCNVNVIEPLPYDEMINELLSCSLVISDSGGLQEECSFLNKKILVCRDATERPESVGNTSFLTTIENLKDLFYEHIKNPTPMMNHCPYGDGNSAQKILEILKNEKVI